MAASSCLPPFIAVHPTSARRCRPEISDSHAYEQVDTRPADDRPPIVLQAHGGASDPLQLQMHADLNDKQHQLQQATKVKQSLQLDFEDAQLERRGRIMQKLAAIADKQRHQRQQQQARRQQHSASGFTDSSHRKSKTHPTRKELRVVVTRLPVRLALSSMLLTALLSSFCAFGGFIFAAAVLFGCVLCDRAASADVRARAAASPFAAAASVAAVAVSHPTPVAHPPQPPSAESAASTFTQSMAGADVELGAAAAMDRSAATFARPSSSSSSRSPQSGVLLAHPPTFDSSRAVADSSTERLTSDA